MSALRLLTRMGDLALPPRCPGCGATVSARDRFCVDCWSGLRFIAPPWCAGCQRPFDHDTGEARWCEECLATPPRHAGVRAAVAYGAVSRTLALGLKYGRRTGYAATAARLMRRHLPDDASLLVAVPLHRWRMWTRGYNQAGLIAAALSRLSGVAFDPHALVRTRATPSLRGLSPGARRRAVRDAFAIGKRCGAGGAACGPDRRRPYQRCDERCLCRPPPCRRGRNRHDPGMGAGAGRTGGGLTCGRPDHT